MKVLYFASVRETIGIPEEEIELLDGMSTVRELMTWLKQKDGTYERAFAEDALVRVAVNQEYVTLQHPISKDDEIAFFPPVTGG